MKIADIELGEKPLLLAPMEDVTDPSFRYMCKRFGADVVYTEFISSDGLIRDAAKSLKKLEIDAAERPVGIQLYGHLIEPMVEAARMAEAAGPDIIDINFGCPVKKIAGRGAGSGMMRDVPLMVEMTRRIVQAVRKPVTVKTRLGWDEESKNIEEIALRLQDVGIAALTVHGRTRAQMYRGEADWTLIGKVKNNPQIQIPIIGNGDVDSGPKAAEMFDRYGVDGVMIGRATYGRPWIFREVKHYLATGEVLPQPSVCERVEIAKEHLRKSLEVKDEFVAVGGTLVRHLPHHGGETVLLEEIRKGVRLVSDLSQALYGYSITALELVCTGLENTVGVYRDYNKAEQDQARRVMRELGVGHLADRSIRLLSTGQLRRLFLARALMGEPDILLLDEPCSALDEDSRRQYLDLLDQLAARGISLVFVSHFEGDAPSCINRRARMHQGRLEILA